MKNLQKFALALIVGAMAIGFSAFTTNHHIVKHKKVAGMIADGFIVQTAAATTFQENASPSSLLCQDATTAYTCIYTVTATGASNIPDKPLGYTSSDMNSYLSHTTDPWLTPQGDANRIYVDE